MPSSLRAKRILRRRGDPERSKKTGLPRLRKMRLARNDSDYIFLNRYKESIFCGKLNKNFLIADTVRI